jgi:hypothetical protein
MMDDGGGYGGDFHDSGGDDGACDSDDDEGAPLHKLCVKNEAGSPKRGEAPLSKKDASQGTTNSKSIVFFCTPNEIFCTTVQKNSNVRKIFCMYDSYVDLHVK